ncbi:MAG: hypothetical protein KUG79_11855 [Pseudomonadales bacterium]|nr:hypothetical protein [Pseudomonadales bacterium]
MVNNKNPATPSYDPYDPWMGNLGVSIRKKFYQGELVGKLLAVCVVAVDWLAPTILRKVIGIQQRSYPITVAQRILLADTISQPETALKAIMDLAVTNHNKYGIAWGLGFPWMSKNGLYDENIPFITHTPYAMEALLKLSKYNQCKQQASTYFNGTWKFLLSLHTLYETKDKLALSYAPLDEPRIVINANAYACFAFCLHAVENAQVSPEAKQKARRLAAYVIDQQNEDGSWFYYADLDPGNFIDCFHSCFVLKNLIKASRLDPTIKTLTATAIERGKRYIDSHFLDAEKQLVTRFTERDIKDPFTWDLYDQAEYLGLLIEFGHYSQATAFCAQVRRNFFNNGTWYCKIDILGRRWGKNFARWGIVPFLYHESLLEKCKTMDS